MVDTREVTEPDSDAERDSTRAEAGIRRDVVAVALAVALVVVAIVIPALIDPGLRSTIFARAAPLFAQWSPHLGPGSIPAVVLAALGVLTLPTLARRLRWWSLCAVVWGSAAAWTVSLALIDGWQRGFAGRLTRPDEYLSAVPGVTDIGTTLRGFSGRILDFQPDSWPTHVSGHPPGALLTFVWLDRIGLGGGAAAAWWCVLLGSSATVAVLITLKCLHAQDWARRCAPFLVLFPGLVWVGVSADGYFMAVGAWGVALIAIASTTSGWTSAVAALGGGAVLGFGMFLSYGLPLVGFVVLATIVATRTVRAVGWAILGAAAVILAFWANGFWWLDGYHLVVDRYYQGIASIRPVSYWGWANFAATLCALGPAVAAGIGRVCRRNVWLRPPALLALAGIAAMVAADVSGLTKAETERIWLPFALWVVVSTGALPRRHQRFWLVAQAFVALLINHLLITYW